MPFFFYQKVGGEDAWLEALSDHRQKVIAETKPAFVTVLDTFAVPEDSWGKDDFAKMRYSGPFYSDWDGESIAETIPPFLEFLANLEQNGVNLKCLRLYATGGRGFHCEIPEGVIIPKPPKTGTVQLPYIYREMAMELVTNCMDMRVYTGRKGRMWRTPNIVRTNGRYKVSISLDQALSMTTELYDELTANPCPEYPRDEPEVSTFLAAMFAKAQNKVDAQVKLRAKSKGDVDLLARHKGEFPPTVLRIMAGEGIVPGKGFHPIAMQLAITANALGKTGEQLIELCQGLIQNHESDSQRYNTPRKRKVELLRMFDYTHDSPVYEYSRGGLKSLCAIGVPTSDLDSVTDSLAAGYVSDSDSDEELPEELKDELKAAQASLLEGLLFHGEGIFKRTSEGSKHISNLSFRNPAKMIDTEDGMFVGLEADLYADKLSVGRQSIDLHSFSTRANLSKYCSGRSAIFSGTDTQAGVVQLVLSRRAVKDGKVIYVVRKEGLDIVQDPTVKDEIKKDVIWASTDGVMTENSDVQYRFMSKVAASPVFRTDIHLAKELTDTAEIREWLHNLLSINSPVIVAQMIGWFVSCFHRQFYHAAYSQFPLLHPNGPAGSGKTLTTTLLARMFHLTTPPVVMGCSANSSTPFTLKGAWTGSASVPVILDEYKPSELGQARTDFLLQHFRMLYNQSGGASGGINRGGADSSFRDITHYTYSAPTVFLGESQEMQTAIVQRSLPISFNPADSGAHTKAFNAAVAGADFMPQLGRSLLGRSLLESTASRCAALDPLRESLRGQFDRAVHDRQVFNLAVVLCGLEFLDDTLESIFDGEFKPQLALLKAAIYEHKADINISAMSEASKVLNDMSLISRTEDSESEFALREGYEYLVGDGYIEILMRESFVKYFAWSKRKGFNPLFQNNDSFISAMGKSPAMVDKTCFDSKLREGMQSKIFRFDLEKLVAEGVEEFSSKSAR